MKNYEKYNNGNGTYTSPKNGKVYKSLKAFIAHIHHKGIANPETIINFNKQTKKISCSYCLILITSHHMKIHEKFCYLNPNNIKLCKVCTKPIKDYRHTKGTCSCACSNTYFRSGINHGNIKQYRTICFLYHKKECIICKENIIVEAHHYDRNNKNNKPDNLIPLCPTHHKYYHSRHRILINNKIDKYRDNFKKDKR